MITKIVVRVAVGIVRQLPPWLVVDKGLRVEVANRATSSKAQRPPNTCGGALLPRGSVGVVRVNDRIDEALQRRRQTVEEQ